MGERGGVKERLNGDAGPSAPGPCECSAGCEWECRGLRACGMSWKKEEVSGRLKVVAKTVKC